ncbi:hypothetical protein WS9_015330 [Paraclostridium sordellii 8483]|uniref:hypothetical protein n=1 Tax=Paraclostridium sordellii TaxID=1505 RepID=UPI0002E3C574|nr:hypothetical protein [Paeniclostridium sordellii]TAN63850.1 hypothetical protein WS9_015330 [Paeniclostridium sordellii 8483]
MKDIDKYIELSEELVDAGEKHLEALRAFEEYKDDMNSKEFEEMIKNSGDKYIKLSELEERYSVVENEIDILQ